MGLSGPLILSCSGLGLGRSLKHATTSVPAHGIAFGLQERSAASPDILVNVVPSSPATKAGSHPEEDMRLEDLENLPGQVLTSQTSLGLDFTQ